MTKKDYELIATPIRRELKGVRAFDRKMAEKALVNVSEALCNSFVFDNPKFDRTKFLQACGIEATDVR